MCIEIKEAITWWTLDPLALGTVGASSTLYGTGLAKLWRTAGIGAGITRREAGAFFLGQLSLVLALVSPIDRLSDYLFSAHMLQHEVLLVVAPPLIIWGKPIVAAAWAFGPARRAQLVGILRAPVMAKTWRVLSAPVAILLLHALTLWVWHIPILFEAALKNEGIHAIQHATFFGTAAIFWWAILRGRYGRAGYGLAAAFVFATAMHTSVLGALVTVASRVWYPAYGPRGAPWGVDVLGDQQLAGLIMWIPAGVMLTLVALALFAAWLGEAGRQVARAERRRALHSARK